MSKKLGTQGTNPLYDFPSDIVPEDEGEKQKWMRACSDAIYMRMSMQYNQNDFENYDFAQGILNEDDFAHMTRIFGGKGNRVLPTPIQAVNGIARMVNDVIGRADEVPFAWEMSVVNPEAISEKLERLVDRQVEKLTRYARQNTGVNTILGRPLHDDDVYPVSPQELESETMLTYQEEDEKQVSMALRYLLEDKKQALKHRFIHGGLYNYIITGKIAFCARIDMANPTFDYIDTKHLIWDWENESPWIQKGRYAGYNFSMTPQAVIDRCPNMTEEEVRMIQTEMTAFAAGTLANSYYWFRHERYRTMNYVGQVQRWKGMKKKLCKITVNPYDADNPHVHFVKKKEEEGEGITYEYRYFNVQFECTRIGNVCYQMRESPLQLADEQEPSEIDLDIIGYIDPIPSLVQIVKPLEKMRIEALSTLSRLTTQTVGRILIVDEAIEQDGPENLYNMFAYRVYKVDSSMEGDQQGQGGSKTKQMPVSVDMGLSDSVNQLMMWLTFLDRTIMNITGMNETYQGGVKSDQGLGVTQLAVHQAQRALQPYYATFNTVVEQVLQKMTDMMRPAWAGKTTTRYWMGDKAANFFSLSPEVPWENRKYGVFMRNTVASEGKRQQLINMAAQLLPITKDPDLAMAIVKMGNAESAPEAEAIFSQGVRAMKKLQAYEMQMREQEIQNQRMAVQGKIQTDAAAEQQKNQTDIAVATIKDKGETQRLIMELEHAEAEQTVEQRGEVQRDMAKHLMQGDLFSMQNLQSQSE